MCVVFRRCVGTCFFSVLLHACVHACAWSRRLVDQVMTAAGFSLQTDGDEPVLQHGPCDPVPLRLRCVYVFCVLVRVGRSYSSSAG